MGIAAADPLFERFRWHGIVAHSLILGYLLVGLYHLLLYVQRRQDGHNLLFGLACVLLAAYWVHSTPMREIIPIEWSQLRARIEFVTLYLTCAIMMAFINYFVDRRVHPLIYGFGLLWLAAAAATLLAPPGPAVARILRYWQYSALVAMVVSVVYLALRVVRHNRNARRIAAGISALVIVAAHDVLAAMGFLNTPPVARYFFLVLVFSMAALLARRFVQVHNASELLNAELTRKNEQLSRLDKLKDEFLANTSHELRTPLNGIIGIADSLLDGAAGALNATARNNLKLIAASGRRLANLINDILDFSRLRNRQIEMRRRPVDLHAVVELVITVLQPLAKGKDLRLVNATEPGQVIVLADENRLQQILNNLVGNAIKFTEAGEVRVNAEAQSEDWWRVLVSDTGIGIPVEKQEDIFQSFEQADASIERSYGGAGLGLSITRQLVQLHGGEIDLQSQPGAGSVFRFTLPASSEPAQSAEGTLVSVRSSEESEEAVEEKTPAATQITEVSPTATNGARAPLVLVADDEAINRQVLVNLLSLRGFRVIEAADGEATMAALEKEKPDLLLLDVMMPRMNGFEVCRQIRQRYHAAELPVILLTARNQIEDLVQGLEAGGNDYLTKPFSRAELLARMNTQLGVRDLNLAVARFLPIGFLDQLGKGSIAEVRLGDAVRRDLTVMFSDIRDFTGLSERMSPEETIAFLNRVFGAAAPIVREHRGFIDKFIGDAIMAIFPESPEDALRCALAMRRRLKEYNADLAASGRPEIASGTGIHCGSVMLGAVGESQRIDGTVVSDAVNLAARVESLTKTYGAGIVISQDVLARLEDPTIYNYRFLDQVRVRGKSIPVSVYEFFDEDPPEIIEQKRASRRDFEEGVQLFHDGRYDEAGESFQRALMVYWGDVAAAHYLKQARHFAVHRPLELA